MRRMSHTGRIIRNWFWFLSGIYGTDHSFGSKRPKNHSVDGCFSFSHQGVFEMRQSERKSLDEIVSICYSMLCHCDLPQRLFGPWHFTRCSCWLTGTCRRGAGTRTRDAVSSIFTPTCATSILIHTIEAGLSRATETCARTWPVEIEKCIYAFTKRSSRTYQGNRL